MGTTEKLWDWFLWLGHEFGKRGLETVAGRNEKREGLRFSFLLKESWKKLKDL